MSLTAKLEVNIAASLISALDLVTATAPLSTTFTPLDLTSGTGINQADKIFSDRRSLSASGSENIDLYDFAGATDALGGTLALARVKLLLVSNRNTTAGDILRVGGLSATTAWNSPFNGDDDATVDVAPGGVLVLAAPSAAAFAVADVTNHLLKFANVSASNTLAYDLVVIGASA